MPKWLRKALVLTVTILTFGIITPPLSFYDEVSGERIPSGDTLESESSEKVTSKNSIQLEQPELSEKELVIKQLVKDAEVQSYTKFGNRIRPVIEDEFKDIILPNIEKVIHIVAEKYDEKDLRHLAINERPSGGNSEKIFHIADIRKNHDIIRFHVRKDHPPHEGYWFNFHYHIYIDGFQEHYDLGSIFWNKNTPPKWMS